MRFSCTCAKLLQTPPHLMNTPSKSIPPFANNIPSSCEVFTLYRNSLHILKNIPLQNSSPPLRYTCTVLSQKCTSSLRSIPPLSQVYPLSRKCTLSFSKVYPLLQITPRYHEKCPQNPDANFDTDHPPYKKSTSTSRATINSLHDLMQGRTSCLALSSSISSSLFFYLVLSLDHL